MSPSDQEIIFADNFDSKLDQEWSWLRQDPDGWRLQDGGLEIRVEPGLASERVSVARIYDQRAGTPPTHGAPAPGDRRRRRQ